MGHTQQCRGPGSELRSDPSLAWVRTRAHCVRNKGLHLCTLPPRPLNDSGEGAAGTQVWESPFQMVQPRPFAQGRSLHEWHSAAQICAWGLPVEALSGTRCEVPLSSLYVRRRGARSFYRVWNSLEEERFIPLPGCWAPPVGPADGGPAFQVHPVMCREVCGEPPRAALSRLDESPRPALAEPGLGVSQ